MTISTAARQLTFGSYNLENVLRAYLRCLFRRCCQGESPVGGRAVACCGYGRP
jgi:hypothetical protein